MGTSVIFRSKRSAWFSLSMALPLAFAIVLAFQDPWYISLVMLPVLVLIIPIYFRTYYSIHDINQLTIVCGLFYRKRFGIHDIVSVRPTGNVMSSPALSLDRIELRFRDRNSVLVSPVRQEQFIETLLRINPEIEIRKRYG